MEASFSLSAMGMENESSFVYFERLPIGFHPELMQYELADFAYTDWLMQADSQITGLFYLVVEGEKKAIQLF